VDPRWFVELLVAVSPSNISNIAPSSVAVGLTVGLGTVEVEEVSSSPVGAVVATVGLGTDGEKVSSPEMAYLPLPVQVWPLGQHPPAQQVEPLRQ